MERSSRNYSCFGSEESYSTCCCQTEWFRNWRRGTVKIAYLGLQRWKLLEYRFGCKFKIFICRGNTKFIQPFNLLVVRRPKRQCQSASGKQRKYERGPFYDWRSSHRPEAERNILEMAKFFLRPRFFGFRYNTQGPFVCISAQNRMVVFINLAPTASTRRPEPQGRNYFIKTTRRGTRINLLGVLVNLNLSTWLRSAESQIFYQPVSMNTDIFMDSGVTKGAYRPCN